MRYNKDEDYFKIINTEEKAYFLGLLFADGTIASDRISTVGKLVKRNQIAIALQERDKNILIRFLQELNSNYPIYNIPNNLKNANWSNQCCVTITSEKMSQDLIRLGCSPNKTTNISFPNTEQVPDNLLSSFIRGYFDGDGCIWIGKRKKIEFNDGALNKKRTRIIHNIKFTFTGHINFITVLKTQLIQKIGLNDVKLQSYKNPLNTTLEYSGKKNIEKLHNFMYNNSTVYLIRKKIIFDQILKRADIQ